MNIAIIEDNCHSALLLKTYLEQYGDEKDLSFHIAQFPDAIQFLDNYHPIYSVVFMDIEMPYMDGMTASGKLRKFDQTVVLIFVTNLAQYAVDGYQVEATDYILKPLDKAGYGAFAFRFERALRKVANKDFADVVISVSGQSMRISCDDIYYIESMNHKLIYHTVQGEYVAWDSLSHIEEQLDQTGFARCSASYLVNLIHVKSVSSCAVTVENTSLNIGRSKKKGFLDALTRYMGVR